MEVGRMEGRRERWNDLENVNCGRERGRGSREKTVSAIHLSASRSFLCCSKFLG